MHAPFIEKLSHRKNCHIENGPGRLPPALIDGQGCLRKGTKSSLVKRVGVVDISPKSADTIIVDVSQLFYHITWPHGGSPSDLVASIEERL